MTARKTYLEVNLANYRHNLGLVRRRIGPEVKLMAVVKANAYGHGLVRMAQAASEFGADVVAVALAEEGEQLRQAGLNLPILILAAVNEDGAKIAARAGLTLTLYTLEQLMLAEKAAAQNGVILPIHIKVDSGMGRIGVRSSKELSALLTALKSAKHLRLEGAFTHFADADRPETGYTDMQLARFKELCKGLPHGLCLHAANSPAILTREDAFFSMVRTGQLLYGYPPVESDLPFRPCMSWYAEITHVKTLPKGEGVSYGVCYVTPGPAQIATLAVGYGDGYSRAFSDKGIVLVHGVRCPVVGRVCMDQVMVDVSKVEGVKAGDQAVLLGRQGDEAILADELALMLGTISYDILLSASARVPIIYIDREDQHADG